MSILPREQKLSRKAVAMIIVIDTLVVYIILHNIFGVIP